MNYIKHLIMPAICLVYFCGCSASGLGHKTGAEAITSDLIKKHVGFLAGDSLMGRNTPSPGLDTAANYIARQFARLNVAPVNGSYFQKVPLGIVSLGKENFLKISLNGVETSYRIKDQFTPFEMTAGKEAAGKIVFAGYGITAPEYNYDDYNGIDVKGKVVFIIKHEPGEDDPSSVFEGRKATEYSEIREKVENAINHGALAVLIATDPLNHSLLSPRGYPWPSLSRFIPADALPLTLTEEESHKVPVVQVGEDVIRTLFGSVDSLKILQRNIDLSLKSCSFEISNALVSVKTSTSIVDRSARNVLGFIEGTDPQLKAEVVVIGAHYDHVGIKKQYEPGSDYIFNGADDNASGTSGLLAVAEAFAAGERPRRSVLFIAFAGEEAGLLGSQAYVNNPARPLEKTVAMLNMDMIGRNNPDSLYIIAAGRSPELNAVTVEENEKVGFILRYNLDRFISGSDHANFLKRGIPVLFYSTGEHADYHQVSDNPETLDYNKAARAARLVYLTARRVAEDNRHYRVLSKTITLF